MARKPRYRPEQEVKKIEIERNVIEQFLMDAKDLLKNNRKLVLYSIAGVFVILVVVLACVIAVDHVNTRNNLRFEKIMDDYTKNSAAGDNEKVKASAAEMKKFVDETYFGFAHTMGFYALGNMYYGQKEYGEAKKCLVRYAEKQPKTGLAPLALLKAAIALEEMNDLKGAMEIYKRLEDRYSESIVADQIFFNQARVYGKMKDLVNARNSYNRVIKSFPESAYAQTAKKRLFMLGGM
jgi:tetratricopeptide (TPR) repeat protein